MITATLDGRQADHPPGTTLLTAFQAQGVTIPTLCHSPRLTPQGRCGLCLVEADGETLPACQTLLEAGKSYQSASPAVIDARRRAMDFILRDHPLNCPQCPATGDCRLEEAALELGFEPVALPGSGTADCDDRHPFIHRRPDLCIRCGLCAAACRDIQGEEVFGMLGRGEALEAEIPPPLRSLEEAGCVACGQCLFECPTGALLEPPESAGKQPDEVVSTTCGYCGVGCRLLVSAADGKILRVEPDPAGSANRGHACVKGRFGHGFNHHPDRLTTPLIRDDDGHLQPATWEEALTLIAERFTRIDPRAFGVVSSARCTNEENFLLQKFARMVMKTNTIDNCARVCHSPSAFALGEALGTGAGTNSFEDIERSDLLLIVGANPTASHPVLGARIKQAVKKGCKLIVIDPRATELARMADIHLALKPGSNVPLINALQQVIIEEAYLDGPFIRDHAEGFTQLAMALDGQTPEWAEPLSGVPAASIRAAARLYASVEKAQILWGLGITESCQGTVGAFGLINLAVMTGNLGRPGTGSSPIRGQNNVQGACDMGALPNVFSDYRPVTDAAARKEHEEAWGVDLPSTPGMKMPEMLEAAREGALKGLYLVAQDPAQSDPDMRAVEEALSNLEFLVVQEIFPSASSRFAHVVLPGASFFEKSGTFVNSDRRIQRVAKAVAPPGDAKTDGEIVHAIARAMGVDLGDPAPEKVMEEIAALTPNWGGVNYARLEEKEFLQWPCPDENHPGTAIVHENGAFLRGRARLTPTPMKTPVDGPDDDFPLLLTTGRALYHYNVGTMTRRTPIATLKAGARESLRIHPEDAERLGVATGDAVRLVSRQGEATAVAEVIPETRPGVVFMSFHFPETKTNLLVGSASDDYTRCPEYKVTPIRLEKIW